MRPRGATCALVVFALFGVFVGNAVAHQNEDRKTFEKTFGLDSESTPEDGKGSALEADDMAGEKQEIESFVPPINKLNDVELAGDSSNIDLRPRRLDFSPRGIEDAAERYVRYGKSKIFW